MKLPEHFWDQGSNDYLNNNYELKIRVSAWIFEIYKDFKMTFFVAIFDQNKVHNPMVNDRKHNNGTKNLL